MEALFVEGEARPGLQDHDEGPPIQPGHRLSSEPFSIQKWLREEGILPERLMSLFDSFPSNFEWMLDNRTAHGKTVEASKFYPVYVGLASEKKSPRTLPASDSGYGGSQVQRSSTFGYPRATSCASEKHAHSEGVNLDIAEDCDVVFAQYWNVQNFPFLRKLELEDQPSTTQSNLSNAPAIGALMVDDASSVYSDATSISITHKIHTGLPAEFNLCLLPEDLRAWLVNWLRDTCRAESRQHPTAGSGTSTNPSTNSSQSTSNTSRNEHQLVHNQNPDDRHDRPNKRRKRGNGGHDANGTIVKNGNSGKQRLFACPFYKHNSRKYWGSLWRSCPHGWKEVRQVREHVRRRHALPEFKCPRCQEYFETREALDSHCQEPIACIPSLTPVVRDGTTAEQRRNFPFPSQASGRTEEDRWRRMYSICFPREPIPSPYHVSNETNSNENIDLLYQVFLEGLTVSARQILLAEAGLPLAQSHVDRIAELMPRIVDGLYRPFTLGISQALHGSASGTTSEGDRGGEVVELASLAGMTGGAGEVIDVNDPRVSASVDFSSGQNSQENDDDIWSYIDPSLFDDFNAQK